MGAITIETRIEAPAQRVWAILADLKAISDYHPWVVRAVLAPGSRGGVGAGRMVHMRDGKSWVNERVVESEEGVRQVVELVATSFPLSSRTVTTELVDVDGRNTDVRLSVQYRFKFGPVGLALDYLILRNGVHRMFTDSLTGLKYFAETGKSSSNWLMSPSGIWVQPVEAAHA